MDNYVARANIDHFLECLQDPNISAENKSAINRLLIAEGDRLSRDVEQLEFAESRAAECRDRVARLRNLRDCLTIGSTDRIQADQLLASCQVTLDLVEGFCHQMRNRAVGRAV